MLSIKGGGIHNAVDAPPFDADILVKNGTIVRIAQGIHMPGARVFDAVGPDVYPGFIDAHTHIGRFGFSGAATKADAEAQDPAESPRAQEFTAIRIAKECGRSGAHDPGRLPRQCHDRCARGGGGISAADGRSSAA